jgi:hypothetical protein
MWKILLLPSPPDDGRDEEELDDDHADQHRQEEGSASTMPSFVDRKYYIDRRSNITVARRAPLA